MLEGGSEEEQEENDEEDKPAKEGNFIFDTLSLMKNDTRAWIVSCMIGATG